VSYALALQAVALDVVTDWNLFVITLPGPAGGGGPRPVLAPPVSSSEARFFHQSGKFQAVPVVNGHKAYGPEFATEAEAVYAAGLIRHAAGESRPSPRTAPFRAAPWPATPGPGGGPLPPLSTCTGSARRPAAWPSWARCSGRS
jgi:hypothetical protein